MYVMNCVLQNSPSSVTQFILSCQTDRPQCPAQRQPWSTSAAMFLIVPFSLLQIFPSLSHLVAVADAASRGPGRGQGFCGPLYLSTKTAPGRGREKERRVLGEISSRGTWRSSMARASLLRSPAAGGSPWPTQQQLGRAGYAEALHVWSEGTCCWWQGDKQ